MRRSLYILIFLVDAVSPLIAQNPRTIEDTIAGITVGKSTLGDIQHKFGSRLIVDEGRHAVRWDGECELFFDFGLDDSDRPTKLVENIQLLNLGKGDRKQSPCNQVATGRGLKLSDSPERVRALYGPAKQIIQNEMNTVGYNSKPRCPKGSKRAIILHDMGIEWLSGTHVLHNINLGVTNTTCDDLDID